MRPVRHSQVRLDGEMELHVAEMGEGPPVVLCHGFPELWLSWRDQLPALADAGFRAIAPDMPGYGGSSAPADLSEYDTLALSDRTVELLDRLGEERAVFVGHDWGAGVVWQLARAHPERVAGVVGLSVPFTPRGERPPIQTMRQRLGDDFYFVWFQEPGVAEAALSRDVRRTILATEVWNAEWAKRDDGRREPPPWMSEEVLDRYVETFTRTGFTGGLSYYRAADRSWERSRPLDDRRVERPAMFMVGERDAVRLFMSDAHLDDWVPDLRRKIVVDGAGHWLQQERPDEVNRELLGFLEEVGWGA